MKTLSNFLLFLLFLPFCGCERPATVDPLRRATVDDLNRRAFLLRYRQPDSCVLLSDSALCYVADSLPAYHDGALRAYNNKAFAHFLVSDYDAAHDALRRVEQLLASDAAMSSNAAIEGVIARLMRARLMQRDCQIADSYRLLYSIDSSGILRGGDGELLHSYALAEYYITLLTLNYHYRDGKEGDVRILIDEVEQRRSSMRVDYAEDMALNYALAYGLLSAGESDRALDYCGQTADLLLRHPASFCLYNYANNLQMTAAALKAQPGEVAPDSILALYEEARRCFFDYGDPYQMLGAVTSTARYALLVSDTLFAHAVLEEWRALRGTWTPFAAPKMELGYFDVLIRSRLADSPDQNRRWYMRRCELQDYIAQNEREDFALQLSLDQSHRRNRSLTFFALALILLLASLVVLSLLLARSARRLRREKRQLEEAKRRDVERIANVETCLSVLRHDVSPFVSYLSRSDLPSALRDEVLGQLLRTFDNIKSWTSLSIPSGLVFNASRFDVQALFDEVSRQVVPSAAIVKLCFEPSDCRIWGDRLLVVILLRNLVNNALQHTTAGSIIVSAQPYADDGAFVHITVRDTGRGMSAEQLEGLFRADRYDSDAAGHLSGDHGFGLILCRYIVKKHDDLTRRGCRLWAESEEGQGSVFHLLLADGSHD